MVLLLFLLLQVAGFLVSLLLPNKAGGGVILCGLFGFNGKNPADATKLRWLACLNERRGGSSTGVFSVKEDKLLTQTLYKKAVMATKFILDTNFIEATRGATSVLGHTRAATIGSVNDQNAHPFEYDFSPLTANPKAPLNGTRGRKVIGAHNGWIVDSLVQRHVKQFGFEEDDLKLLPGFQKEQKAFDVDSMLIFAALAKTGDYKVMPTIEGAIACSFMMPDKYPGIVFLYKRKARDLHIGRSREGIYWSSEDEPLELVGCDHIESVPDDYIILLKDGEIFDMHEMEKPKIKSLHQGVSNKSWKLGVPKEELDAYEETAGEEPDESQWWTTKNNTWDKKLKKWVPGNEAEDNTYSRADYAAVRRSPKQVHIPFKPQEDIEELEVVVYDELNSLIKDVREEIENVDNNYMCTVKDYRGTDLEEEDCSILILQLLNSTHRDPCPGWLVFDKINDTVMAASAINGVAVVKYDKHLCGAEQTLVFVDPIDPTITFTYTINPVNNRVMEVTLELPFPQGFIHTAADTASNEESKLSERCTDMAAAINTGIHDDLERKGDFSRLTTENSCDIPKSAKQIYLRPEEGQAIGKPVCRGEEVRITSSTNSSIKPDRNPADAPLMMPAARPRFGVIEVITNENKSFFFKNAIKTALNSREFLGARVKLHNYFGKFIRVDLLLTEAGLRREHDKYFCGTCYTVGTYAYDLLKRFNRDKRYSLSQKELNSQDTLQYEILLKEFRNNEIGPTVMADEQELEDVELRQSVVKELIVVDKKFYEEKEADELVKFELVS